MAQFVAVFDVVVHERIIVQNFNRCRRVQCVVELGAFGLRDLEQQARTQAFSAPRGPVLAVTEVIKEHIGDLLGSPIISYQSLEMNFEAFLLLNHCCAGSERIARITTSVKFAISSRLAFRSCGKLNGRPKYTRNCVSRFADEVPTSRAGTTGALPSEASSATPP